MLITRKARYEPTDEDRLWLLRAVEREGAPQRDVAATLVNGFMWARDRLGSTRTLTDWVRAYAQPINPEWFASGLLFQKALARIDREDERAHMRHVADLREHVFSTETQFSPSTIEAVDAALSSAPRLTEATDYAAPSLERHEPWIALTDPEPGINRFWVRPGAIGWTGYRVAPSSSGAAGAALVLVLVAIGVGFLLARGRV